MKLTKYKITLKSHEDTVLPGYLGSMLRGAFGEALMQYDEDLFNKFFKNKIDENSPVYKYTNETPPPPFIFNPLKKYEFIRKKQYIIFTLSLIGDYRHYGTSIPEIMEIMCENKMHNQKLKTEIKNIEIINNPLNNSKLFDFKDFQKLIFDKKQILFNLKTPMEIANNKQLISDFSFERIFNFLYRRLYILNQIYGEKNIPENIPENINKKVIKINTINIQVNKHTVYRSSSVSGKYPMSGWKGKIRYSGDFTELYPYLKFGEQIHIGSNTVFGFGKYILQ